MLSFFGVIDCTAEKSDNSICGRIDDTVDTLKAVVDVVFLQMLYYYSIHSVVATASVLEFLFTWNRRPF